MHTHTHTHTHTIDRDSMMAGGHDNSQDSVRVPSSTMPILSFFLLFSSSIFTDSQGLEMGLSKLKNSQRRDGGTK